MLMIWNSGWAWWQASLMWLIYALVTDVIGRGRQPERDGEQMLAEVAGTIRQVVRL